MGSEQQFCLRWNNHQSTLVAVFDTLLESGTLVDCTLAAEGQYLKAHKVVLSACSPYFELLLSQHYEKHPIVILKDVKFQELKAMMDYMYRGEVNISQDQLGALLKAAESLQIKGLSDSGGGGTEREVEPKRRKESVPPPPTPARTPPILQHSSSGLTIEHRRTAQPSQVPQVIDLPEDAPPPMPLQKMATTREGSISPVSRKRKKHRRRSSCDENSLGAPGVLPSTDNHETSSSCELPPQSQVPPAPSIPATITPVTSTPIPKPSLDTQLSHTTEEKNSDSEIMSKPLASVQGAVASPQTMPIEPEPVVHKVEPQTEPLLEPKSEYLEEVNDDSVEDLTLDDDMDDMDQPRAGPSHGGEGSSSQGTGFAPWHVTATDRSTDEVFMAAQEAVGAHRDSQGEASLAVELPEEGTTASSTQGEAVPSTSQHQTAITEYVPKRMGQIQKKKVDSKLMGLFTKDYQPFSIVNDSGFRSFVHALNPAYEIPSRRIVTNVMLPAAYAEANEKVQQKLQGIKTICLTTDCWTSASNESYMAVTGHFINEQFRLQSVLLECSHFSGAHTSSNLSTALIKITDKFSLGGKILMVVTDNAPNIKNAISTILKWKHFGCYAHTLNLVVQDALKNVQEVHQKVKKIVGFFKRSSSATERLLTCQQNSGKGNIKKLIQDLPTRWNSTLFMLERFVELSEALCNRPTDLPSLSNDEWEICSELCSILKPFEQVSRQLSAEEYPTGSLVIVLTRGLLAVCDEIAKMQLHEGSMKVVEALKEGLTNRFSNLEQSKSIALATLLDPRFKLLAFQNQAAADNTKKQLINIVAQKLEKCRPVGIQPSQSVEPNNLATASFSVWGIFDKLVKHAQPQGTVQSCAIVEVQRYIDSSVINRNEDPLAWWRQNQYIYPTIAKVVKERFNVVATSVPCERVFSKTGHLINDRRTRLKPSNIEKLIFLNANGTCD